MNAEKKQPGAATTMLIRKPADEVFEALVNPEVTSKFWFTKGSGRLEKGKTVTWKWEQFEVQAEIIVTELKPEQLILFQWPADETGEEFRTVRIDFQAKTGNTTFVSVTESGFNTDDPDLLEQVAGQTGGWALVLSGLKAWLEFGVELNVISDHHPG